VAAADLNHLAGLRGAKELIQIFSVSATEIRILEIEFERVGRWLVQLKINQFLAEAQLAEEGLLGGIVQVDAGQRSIFRERANKRGVVINHLKA
jgi:hypothetical protein